MLHHTNVDRFWAYWQAIHPTQDIFSDTYAGQSRFSSPAGSSINNRTPLAPFFGRGGVPHTTQSVRSIRGFGYSYEGLEYWSRTPAQMSQSATALINRLYGPSGGSSSSSSDDGDDGDDGFNDNAKRDAPQHEKRRYFAHVTVDRADLPKPCQIEVNVDGRRGGSLVVMNQPAVGILKAALTLDRVLEPVDTDKLAPDSTRDTITKGLTVRIVKTDGTTVEHPGSLKVTLEDVLVKPPPSRDEFPKYGASKLSKVNDLNVNLNLKVKVEIHV